MPQNKVIAVLFSAAYGGYAFEGFDYVIQALFGVVTNNNYAVNVIRHNYKIFSADIAVSRGDAVPNISDYFADIG